VLVQEILEEELLLETPIGENEDAVSSKHLAEVTWPQLTLLFKALSTEFHFFLCYNFFNFSIKFFFLPWFQFYIKLTKSGYLSVYP